MRQMLLESIKKHYIAIIFAAVVAALAIAPHLVFMFSPGNNYQGINMFKSSDEEAYMSSVLSASLGRTDTLAPYLYEYKDKQNPAYSFQEYILAGILKYSGIGVGNMFLVLKFLGAGIVFFLIYYLVNLIGGNKISALLAPSLIIMALGIVGQSPMAILDNILWRGGNIEFWDYIRLLNPAFSGIFFFVALIAVFNLFSKPGIRAAIFAGAAFGALFYIYLYFWTFALVLLGLLLVYALTFKLYKQAQLFFISIAIGVLVGAPQLVRLFDFFKKITTGAEGLFNQTVVANRDFIFEKVVIISLFLYALFCLVIYLKGRLDKNLIFPGFLIASGIVVVNQQVITGQSIQPHHYYFFTNLPAAYIGLVIIFGYAHNLIHSKYIRSAIIVPIFVIIFLWGIGVQATSYKYYQPIYRHYQNYVPVFAYLQKNAPPDSVIYARDDVSEIISANLGYFIYSSPHASESFYLSDERREIMFFLKLKLNGIDKASAREYFYGHRDEVGGWFFGQVYREKCGRTGCFPDEIMEKLISDYNDFLTSPLELEAKKYKIDFLIWDKNKDPAWRISDWSFLEPIYDQNGIHLFKVK